MSRVLVEYQADDEDSSEDMEIEYEMVGSVKKYRLRDYVDPETKVRNKCKYDLVVGTSPSSMYSIQMEKHLALTIRHQAKATLQK